MGAVHAASALYGRDVQLDAYLRAQRHFPVAWLHDPEIALFAGESGQELILKLIEQAQGHLTSSALFALEIGIGQAESLAELLAKKNYRDIELKSDYSGTTRFLFARYG